MCEKTKLNVDTMVPMSELSPECVEFLRGFGSNSTTVADVLQSRDPAVYRALENGNLPLIHKTWKTQILLLF